MRARFAQFAIDSETRQLLSHGREIHLSPKAFDLSRRARRWWKRPTFARESGRTRMWWTRTSNILIGEIRRALDDSVQDSRFIRTVYGVGYAFCGTAADDPRPRTEGQAPFCWVVWNGRTYPLAEGDNIIGRDPRSDMWLDADGVSRRHAIIRVDSSHRRVRLEDLGSTNGTFVGRTDQIEKTNLSHLLPVLGHRLLWDIDAKHVSQYQHLRLQQGAAPKTINLEVGTLRAIMRRHRLWANLQPDVRMLPTRDDIGKSLTADEEKRRLDACGQSRSRSLFPAVMVALNTGMRYSEMRLLSWSQVDLEKRRCV